jgi:inner membrane protein
MRALLGVRPRVDRAGRAATAVFVLYGLAMWSGTALAEKQARSWLAARGDLVEDLAAMPMAGNPFVRDVVVASGDRYLFIVVDWWADETVTPGHAPLPRSPMPPPVRVALARAELRGFVNWLRFPTWTVETTEDGYEVTLDDVRYSRSPPAAFGRQVKVLRSEVP